MAVSWHNLKSELLKITAVMRLPLPSKGLGQWVSSVGPRWAPNFASCESPRGANGSTEARLHLAAWAIPWMGNSMNLQEWEQSRPCSWCPSGWTTPAEDPPLSLSICRASRVWLGSASHVAADLWERGKVEEESSLNSKVMWWVWPWLTIRWSPSCPMTALSQ